MPCRRVPMSAQPGGYSATYRWAISSAGITTFCRVLAGTRVSPWPGKIAAGGRVIAVHVGFVGWRAAARRSAVGAIAVDRC